MVTTYVVMILLSMCYQIVQTVYEFIKEQELYSQLKLGSVLKPQYHINVNLNALSNFSISRELFKTKIILMYEKQVQKRVTKARQHHSLWEKRGRGGRKLHVIWSQIRSIWSITAMNLITLNLVFSSFTSRLCSYRIVFEIRQQVQTRRLFNTYRQQPAINWMYSTSFICCLQVLYQMKEKKGKSLRLHQEL